MTGGNNNESSSDDLVDIPMTDIPMNTNMTMMPPPPPSPTPTPSSVTDMAITHHSIDTTNNSMFDSMSIAQPSISASTSTNAPVTSASTNNAVKEDDDFGLLVGVPVTTTTNPNHVTHHAPAPVTSPAPAPASVTTNHVNVNNAPATGTPQNQSQSLFAHDEDIDYDNDNDDFINSSTPTQPRTRTHAPKSPGLGSAGGTGIQLTNEDIHIITKLDEEYENSILEREIGWNARYISVRQNAGLSLWFMVLFLTIGTIFFDAKTDWDLGESLLFSIYTITTVGYGHHVIPKESDVLIFISVYIFLGIATLTIMAAQLYQWVVLEITWARYEHDKNELNKKYESHVQASSDIEGHNNNHGGHLNNGQPMFDFSHSGDHVNGGQHGGPRGGVRMKRSCAASTFDYAVVVLNKVQAFVKDYPYGQLVVVMVPFWLLICIGALVVGSIEGWSFIESMYFSVVSLTTVGYGDFAPRKVASTWFTIIWLPFSVFFVSLYLGSIASFYIGMSNRNVNRIERKLRRKMQRVKTWQEKERDEARLRGLSGGFGVMNNDDDDGGDGGANHTMNNTLPSHIKTPPKMNDNKGFSSLSTNTPDDTNSVDAQSPPTKDVGFRRNEILQKSGSQRTTMSDSDGTVITDHRTERNGETMKTMKDVITAIKLNMSSSRRSLMEESDILGHHGHRHNDNTGGKQEILNLYSTKHYNTARGVVKKPTFALRVLVQERLAQIVAHEVAGYQSNVEIKNNTLSVTIDSLKFTCEKWLLPKRSTKSFRSVAFETLYFVGERSLIVRGAEAVFELRPAEVQGLFGPVLAAMGDADTMEAWLNRTQMLAQTELGQNSGDTDFKLNLVDDRRSNQITQNMTSKPKQQRVVIGNAFTNN